MRKSKDRAVVNEAVARAVEEIEALRRTGKEANYPGLDVVLERLVEIGRELALPELPPQSQREKGIGRIVTDSWPLSSDAGVAAIEAEQAYVRLRIA